MSVSSDIPHLPEGNNDEDDGEANVRSSVEGLEYTGIEIAKNASQSITTLVATTFRNHQKKRKKKKKCNSQKGARVKV